MKIIVPVVIVILIVVGVFAVLKFGKGAMKPASVNQPNVNVATQKVPVSGNPDDVAAAVDRAAGDEQAVVGAEENDSTSVTVDDPEINAIDGSVNENEF